MTPASEDVTQLLQQLNAGDPGAIEKLIPLVYNELRHIASRSLRRERGAHTLQTTALVHEAYLRLVGQNKAQWQNRAQFLGIAAQLVRRILVDHARAVNASKRGGSIQKISLDEAFVFSAERPAHILALDEALSRLAVTDARKCRVVELKFFGGLTTEEIAAVLQVSTVTVLREWSVAKAWLHREVARELPL